MTLIEKLKKEGRIQKMLVLAEKSGDSGLMSWAQAQLHIKGNKAVSHSIPLLIDAVDKGCVPAIDDLAAMYRTGGKGLLPDREMAIALYEMSARLGSVEGIEKCLELYLGDRKEKTRDLEKALFWYKEGLKVESQLVKDMEILHGCEKETLEKTEAVSDLDLVELVNEGNVSPLYDSCFRYIRDTLVGINTRDSISPLDSFRIIKCLVNLVREEACPDAAAILCFCLSIEEVQALGTMEKRQKLFEMAMQSTDSVTLLILDGIINHQDTYAGPVDNEFDSFRIPLAKAVANLGISMVEYAANMLKIYALAYKDEFSAFGDDELEDLDVPAKVWEMVNLATQWYREVSESEGATAERCLVDYAEMLLEFAEDEPGASNKAIMAKRKEAITILVRETEKGAVNAGEVLLRNPDVLANVIGARGALSILKEIPTIIPEEDSYLEMMAMMTIGAVYAREAKKEGLEYFAKAMKLAIKDDDTASLEAVVMGMGSLYLDLEDIDSAISIYRQAVNRGCTNLTGALGMLLLDKGDYASAAESKKWIEQGSHSMQPDALGVFGYSLLYGLNGYDQEVQRGLEMLNESLQLGNAYAGVFLGEAYNEGVVVPQDRRLGRRYLKMASKLSVNDDVMDVFDDEDIMPAAIQLSQTIELPEEAEPEQAVHQKEAPVPRAGKVIPMFGRNSF